MRTVLITGATGAIGSVLTKCLLEEPHTRVRLLLRAESRSHLEQRLRELFVFWQIDPEDGDVRARVDASPGDVTEPLLGLDRSTYQRLTTEVTHVVHSAGNVKLNRSIADARRSAVDAAAQVVTFVDACRASGQFHKLEFVSTVGVAGRMPGIVPERPFSEARTFRNSYEAAKAEAEGFVLRHVGNGLPATVHRPSMVVGDSRTGRIIQFQVFYYLCEFLSGRRTLGVVPSSHGVRLDIIPVDYVARAIQLSSLNADAAGRVFHLCGGPSQAPTIEELAKRVREFFAAHGRPVPALRHVPPTLLRSVLPLASRFVPARTRRSLQSLPYFLAYLDSAAQTFGNADSQQYFSALGLHPPVVGSYLGPVLSYYLSSRKSGSAAGDSHVRGAA